MRSLHSSMVLVFAMRSTLMMICISNQRTCLHFTTLHSFLSLPRLNEMHICPTESKAKPKCSKNIAYACHNMGTSIVVWHISHCNGDTIDQCILITILDRFFSLFHSSCARTHTQHTIIFIITILSFECFLSLPYVCNRLIFRFNIKSTTTTTTRTRNFEIDLLLISFYSMEIHFNSSMGD